MAHFFNRLDLSFGSFLSIKRKERTTKHMAFNVVLEELELNPENHTHLCLRPPKLDSGGEAQVEVS